MYEQQSCLLVASVLLCGLDMPPGQEDLSMNSKVGAFHSVIPLQMQRRSTKWALQVWRYHQRKDEKKVQVG